MATTQITIDQLDKDQIKSFSDFLLSYNKLSELCFIDCVTEFTGRAVSDKEDKCALNCMEKFLKMNQRISQRFQEFQMLANENAIAAAQKLSGNCNIQKESRRAGRSLNITTVLGAILDRIVYKEYAARGQRVQSCAGVSINGPAKRTSSLVTPT